MFYIKRLYRFILKSFLPLFLMTFFICLFIVLMQFLWRYVDEMVGKGLEMSVLAELFFYAAVTMVPMALPLAILLASLMTFGNLGERLELLAIKAAGISLLQIMRPLVIFLIFVAIGAFFFQNYVLPKSQVKMWTLLYSMRQKSPELDIPEGAFYDQITGYNLYVKQKDRETGMLHGMMIYDVSNGYGYANIIVSDSGKLSMTTDRKHLVLQLYSGESFEDLKDNSTVSSRKNTGMLYRRESFKTKEILRPFDATFNRMGDETMSNQYIGKNFVELSHSIDSLTVRTDSIGDVLADKLLDEPVCGVAQRKITYKDEKRISTPVPPVAIARAIDVDSIINSMSVNDKSNVIELAKNKAERLKQEMQFKGYALEDNLATMRRHEIELERASNRLAALSQSIIAEQGIRLRTLASTLRDSAVRALESERRRIDALGELTESRSPVHIMRLGFAIARIGSRTVTSTTQAHAGETMSVEVADGTITTTIKN